MDADDYIERKRLLDMVDEAHRGKQVWMNEYLRMLGYSNAAEKAFKILENAITLASASVRMSILDEPLKEARAVLANEVKPIPTPTDPKRTFRFILQRDFDVLAAPNAMGMYAKPEHQKLWESYQAGVKFGFHDRSKKE